MLLRPLGPAGPSGYDFGGIKVLRQVQPLGLHGIAERLLEAADRKLWNAPDPGTLAALRQAYLETEGDLEGR